MSRPLPTDKNHGVTFSVEVASHEQDRSSNTTHNIVVDDILKWVSLDELTRFEHARFAEEQRSEKARPLRKSSGRPRKNPSSLQPLGHVDETEVTTSGDEEEVTTSSSSIALKRPRSSHPMIVSATKRGRPRKNPVQPLNRVNDIESEENFGAPASPTNPRKRSRQPDEIPIHSRVAVVIDQSDNLATSGSSGRLSRRHGQSIEHIALPQVKKRAKKMEQELFSISSDSSQQQPPMLSPKVMISQGDTLASKSHFSKMKTGEDSDEPEMIYNPVIAYDDGQQEEELIPVPTKSRASKAPKSALSTSDRVPKTRINGDNPTHSIRSETTKPGLQLSDVDVNNDAQMADISSADDELAALHSQFQITSRKKRPQLSVTSTPQTAIRRSHQRLTNDKSRRDALPSSSSENSEIPPNGREVSIDLGASSSSQDSMRRSPVHLQRQPVSQGVIDQNEDQSSDSLIVSPVRLQRPSASGPPPTAIADVVELSGDEALNQSSEYQDAKQDEHDVYANLEIPDIPSSQSFRGHHSSSSSDEFDNVVVQRSEAKATSRRANLNASVSQHPHDTANGRPTSTTSRQAPSVTPSRHEQPQPESAKGQSQLQSSAHSSTKSKRDRPRKGQTPSYNTFTSSHQRLPSQQKQAKQPSFIHPTNPLQPFSSQRPASNSLASLAAGQAFPTSTTTQMLRSHPSASSQNPNSQIHPYGEPLPLHPVTPPTAPNFNTNDINSTDNRSKSKPTTQKRQRQSMTPLFPSAAIVPDLTPTNGSPSKKKSMILSTQQFQG